MEKIFTAETNTSNIRDVVLQIKPVYMIAYVKIQRVKYIVVRHYEVPKEL